MPLDPRPTKKAFVGNVRELYTANASKPKGEKRSRKQILAIAFSEMRRGKAGK